MNYIKLTNLAQQLDNKGFYLKADLITSKLLKISQKEDPPFELREGEEFNDPDTVMKYFIGFGFDMVARDKNISKSKLKAELKKKLADKISEMSFKNKDKYRNFESEVMDELEKQTWYKNLPVEESNSESFGSIESGNTPKEFIESLSGPAQQASAATGNVIPPSVIIAMAAWESGWGKSKLAKDHGNYFGIKQSTTSGSSSSVQMPTHEYGAQGKYKIDAEFAVFQGDAVAAMSALPNFLKNNRRYSGALQAGENYSQDKSSSSLNQLIDEIFDSGYSTDTNEPYNIKQLIKKYNLTQFD
jgi:flagellum-specific peptidoglycan hydrolase FlgJ